MVLADVIVVVIRFVVVGVNVVIVYVFIGVGDIADICVGLAVVMAVAVVSIAVGFDGVYV